MSRPEQSAEQAQPRNTYAACIAKCGGWDETWHGLAHNGVPGRSNHAHGCPEQIVRVRAGDAAIPPANPTPPAADRETRES